MDQGDPDAGPSDERALPPRRFAPTLRIADFELKDWINLPDRQDAAAPVHAPATVGLTAARCSSSAIPRYVRR
jgi:hypothetical protein